MKKVPLKVHAGVAIDESTGFCKSEQPNYMANQLFYIADRDSCLRLLNKNYCFSVATYKLCYDEKYRHTYDYAPEQNWTTYNGDFTADAYQQGVYIFSERCYFRICLKRVDGGMCNQAEEHSINDIVEFFSTEIVPKRPKRFFYEEIKKITQAVLKNECETRLILGVMTDTHVTVNGTWKDTISNLNAVHSKIQLEGLIHLGDLTDGMVPREITYTYVNSILDDMHSLKIPVHVVLGNHDANYFAGNQDVFSINEQISLYQRNRIKEEKPYYYTDYQETGVRCVFLSAYDNEDPLRYGFDTEQIAWVEDVLQKTDRCMKIVFFSHTAPLAELDFWTEEIRNGELLMGILEEHQLCEKNILAFIHGHTHADFVYTKRSVPIVSVGCAKCEDMQEKKPRGTCTAKRFLDEATQDLWDIIKIYPKSNKIEFFRFGAGENRSISLKTDFLHRMMYKFKKWVRNG